MVSGPYSVMIMGLPYLASHSRSSFSSTASAVSRSPLFRYQP